MFAKCLSISDVLMWRWYARLSFKSEGDIAVLKAEVDAGRNPKDAKVALAKEITARFHSPTAADAAEQDFINRSKGGVPDEIAELTLPLGEGGAALGIAALLKSAGLAASSGEGNRLIDGGGVRVDSNVVSDKGLKLGAGTYVLQVGRRKFVRATLT
jgi:tyrosyl-tRNA synthetase